MKPKAERRVLDAYYTPQTDWVVQQLMERVDIVGTVFDPCAGDSRMVEHFIRHGHTSLGNDIAAGGFDARFHEPYPPCDWVVTNPPFNQAYPILRASLRAASQGVAFLLRVTFLEPLKVDPKGKWISENPPTNLIVLPRLSFTGDGNTDSTTCAWFVWEHGKPPCIHIALDDRQLEMDA